MFNSDSDFVNLWDNADAVSSKGGFTSLPDGKYNAKVNSVRFETSNTGKNMISWDLIVTEGEYVGRHIFSNQFVHTASAIGFVKGQFAKLGFDCSSFESVHLAFEQLIDAVLSVTLKTRPASGQYEARQNTYFNSVVSKANSNSVSDPAAWK